MRYYVGPWVWGRDAIGECWAPPRGAGVVVDLRPVVEQAYRGHGVPPGRGLFASSERLPRPYRQVAEDVRDTIAPWHRVAVSEALTARTLDAALWELYTSASDDSGRWGVRPLMPEHDGVLRLYVNGELLQAQPLTEEAEEWPVVLAARQAQYRRYRHEASLGRAPVDFHRKSLTVWQEQFGMDPSVFIPRDLPYESPLPHDTTITDDFIRGDQTPMGTASGAGGATWTSVSGTWSILSNNGRNAGADDTARLEAALSTADHYAQAVLKVNGGNGFTGTAIRFNSGANTAYLGFARVVASSDARLSKMVAGARTDLFTGAGTLAVNDTYYTEVNGSNLTFKINSSTILGPSSDTAITANLYTGLWNFVDNSFNAFQAADLGGGAATWGPLLGGFNNRLVVTA